MHRAYVPRQAEPIELESIEDLRDLAIRITRELREGKLDIKSANALTFAVWTALHAAEVAHGAASANKRASMTPLRFEVEALKELVENGRNGRVKLQAINRLRDLTVAAARFEQMQLEREDYQKVKEAFLGIEDRS